MKKLLILLVLITCTVQAEIYKSQNEKGEWVYSDKPSPSAERMKLPPLSTYAPPALQSAPAQQDEPGDIYKSIVFVEPEDNATIRDNEGFVDVMLRIEPQLKSRQGHKIQYYLDETPYGAPGVGLKLTLENVERGSHVLSAVVLDADGELLFSANPVTFHVHKQSVNQPNRVRPQPLPKAK